MINGEFIINTLCFGKKAKTAQSTQHQQRQNMYINLELIDFRDFLFLVVGDYAHAALENKSKTETLSSTHFAWSVDHDRRSSIVRMVFSTAHIMCAVLRLTKC